MAKSEKITFSLRIDESTYELLKKFSEQEKRSINKQIEIFIENALSEYRPLSAKGQIRDIQ